MNRGPAPHALLEVCIASLADATTCAAAGVARVELNHALELGGLTPPAGLTEAVLEHLGPAGCQVIAMVRPRPGGFAYDPGELSVMAREIERLLEAGVDGVALGVLGDDGRVAAAPCRALIAPVLAARKEAVFHRAFDLTPAPHEALEALVDLGFTRVLTSGQAPTAIAGAAVIRRLIEQAAGRIQVLPGSGITPGNAVQLIHETGCDQVHGSLSHVMQDTSGACRPSIAFASPPPENLGYRRVDPDKIAALMDTLQKTANDPDHEQVP